MKYRTLNIVLIAAAVIIVVPLAVFFFVHQTAWFEGAGDENAWVAFWGAFLGAVITSFISMLILYKQIKNTNKITVYQASISELNNIKQVCARFLNSLDSNVIVDATNSLLNKDYKKAHEILVKQYDVINYSIQELQLFIGAYNCNDEVTSSYNDHCNLCVDKYSKVLNELQLLISALCCKEASYNFKKMANDMSCLKENYLETSIQEFLTMDKDLSEEEFVHAIIETSSKRLAWLDSLFYERQFEKHMVIRTGKYLRDKQKLIERMFLN